MLYNGYYRNEMQKKALNKYYARIVNILLAYW
jgi:hypothetical protein